MTEKERKRETNGIREWKVISDILKEKKKKLLTHNALASDILEKMRMK